MVLYSRHLTWLESILITHLIKTIDNNLKAFSCFFSYKPLSKQTPFAAAAFYKFRTTSAANQFCKDDAFRPSAVQLSAFVSAEREYSSNKRAHSMGKYLIRQQLICVCLVLMYSFWEMGLAQLAPTSYRFGRNVFLLEVPFHFLR